MGNTSSDEDIGTELNDKDGIVIFPVVKKIVQKDLKEDSGSDDLDVTTSSPKEEDCYNRIGVGYIL